MDVTDSNKQLLFRLVGVGVMAMSFGRLVYCVLKLVVVFAVIRNSESGTQKSPHPRSRIVSARRWTAYI